MTEVTIQRLAASEFAIKHFKTNDAINYSYRTFVGFFGRIKTLDECDVTVGAYMTYGWMPTMLKTFRVTNLKRMAAILNRAKQGNFPTKRELCILKASINNSLVGASKLLHFVNPDITAIWDRRVYRYINGPVRFPPVEKIENFLDYIENIKGLVRHRDFPKIRQCMNAKVGYNMSDFRVVEYVMFLSAP